MEFMVPVSYQALIGLLGNICFHLTFLTGTIVGSLVWTTIFRSKTLVFCMQLGCLVSFTGYMFLWISSRDFSTHWSSFCLFAVGVLFTGFSCPLLFCSAAVHLYESSPEAWRRVFGCFPWLVITISATVIQLTVLRIPWGFWISMCSSLAFVTNLLLWQISEPDMQLKQTTSSVFQSLTDCDSVGENSIKSDCDTNASEVNFITSGQVGSCYLPKIHLPTLVWLMLMHHFTGASALTYLSQLMLEFSPTLWHVDYSVAVGLPQVIGVSLACLFVSRIQSVYLLRFSSVMMTGTSFAMGCLLKQPSMIPISSHLIGCIALGLLAFAIGWGPIPWLLVNQMHSTTDRRRAVGVAFFVSSFAKLTVHVTFELLIAVMGIGNYFWMVAVICFCGVFQFQIPRFANRHAVKIPPRLTLNLKRHRMGQACQLDPEGGLHLLGRKRLSLGPRLKAI
ncbi:hypothetical protein FBUS_10960 [Fasciolopsis buskii]|uniref:Uncharacterized protein n=1 Tax=Fasciolopsis buskii TaxID=27845 RepID=A0A8E0RXZ2_9TREM|nr:hypothetical protein FBUS_10960 [Fasciolopsis buski]